MAGSKSNNPRQGSQSPRSQSLQKQVDGYQQAAQPAGRPAQRPQLIVQANQLDPISQSLTDRYLSQQGQSGSPAGQRSPHLVEQAQNSANTAEGVIHKDGM